MAKSLEYLDRAAELAPDTLRYLDIAAHANSVVGNNARAVDLWTARLERGPPQGESHFNIAYACQYNLGDNRRALHHWVQARELLPGNADIALHAAKLLQQTGRTSEADQWLRAFLQRNPGHARSEEIRVAAPRRTTSPTPSTEAGSP